MSKTQYEKFYIVEVLNYTKDSLLAHVRVTHHGGKLALGTYIGYLPTLALHDTLPKFVKDTCRNNNWNEEP